MLHIAVKFYREITHGLVLFLFYQNRCKYQPYKVKIDDAFEIKEADKNLSASSLFFKIYQIC